MIKPARSMLLIFACIATMSSSPRDGHLAGTNGKHPAVSAPETGQISGRIYGAGTGGVLAGVTVTLGSTPRAADVTKREKTAEDGTFSFKDVAPGDYVVSAYQTGFARAAYGMDPRSGGWTPLHLRSGESRVHIDLKLHAYADITELPKEALPAALPAGYYGVGPGLFSDDGNLLAFSLGDPPPEEAWLYDRVSRHVVNVTGGRDVNGSVASLKMAWVGDTLYVQTANTVSQRHSFEATPAGAKVIPDLPPEAVAAMERPQDSFNSAESSASDNQFKVESENQGHGMFRLVRQSIKNQHVDLIASGNWELESFVFDANHSRLLYLETFADWEWGDSYDGAVVILDLRTGHSQEAYLPARAEKLLAAVEEGGAYLAAYTTYGPCVPETLLGGRHPAPFDAAKNVCFATVPTPEIVPSVH